jgi:hypothetical protein
MNRDGDTEQILVGIWREVLARPDVGVLDNFFDLGGHSLLMGKLRSRVGLRLGRDVPMLSLLEHPTVRALAGYLDATAGEPEAADGGPRRPR